MADKTYQHADKQIWAKNRFCIFHGIYCKRKNIVIFARKGIGSMKHDAGIKFAAKQVEMWLILCVASFLQDLAKITIFFPINKMHFSN